MMARKLAEQADNFLDIGGSINTVSMTYDNRGNVKTETLTHYNGQTDKVTVTYNYDNYNRLQSEIRGFGTTAHTTTYAYAYSLGSTTVTNTDPAGYVSSQTIDASQKLVTAIDYGGTLTYEYNSIGNQTKVKYNGSDISTMGYDIYGRQTSLNDKNAGLTTYEYNGFGELYQQTHANGQTYTFSYDLLGRNIQRVGTEGTTVYQYHSTGNGKNRIKKVLGFNGINEDYLYDNLHRMTQYQQTIDGVAHNTSYTYNNFSDVATVTYPSGFGIRREYDNNGYLQRVKNLANTVTLFTGTAINAFGQYKNYTLGNGASSTVSYTPYGQPARYLTSGIQDLNLNFNLTTGNLTSRYDALKNRTESFQYDNLYRLKSSQVTGYSAYQVNYSDNGNISNKSDAGLTYTYHASKINAVSGLSSSQNISLYQQDIIFTPYQQPGVITEQTGATMPYQLTYTYGPDHERRKSVLAQGTSTLHTRLYLGEQENNTTVAGTQNIHYISGGNGLCAVVVRQNGIDTYYYVYSDHLGSILTLTNASGVIAAEQNFDAWGRKRNPATWHYSSVPAVPSWLYRGYTGHEELSEFKLINMNGRLYDPVVGRMLSVDNYVQSPDQTQSYNRYSYVHNNPLKYTDPSGENPAIIAGAIIGGVINGVRHIGKPQGFIKGFVIGAIAGAVAGATMGIGGSAIAGGGSFFATTSASVGTAVVSTAYSSAVLGMGNLAAFGEPYSHDQWVRDIYIGAALGFAGGTYQYLVTPRGYATVDLDELARNGFGGVIDDLGQPVAGPLAGKTAYSYELGAGAAETGTTALKSLGRGSTGRTVANNLVEEMAMEAVVKDPTIGRVVMTGMNDPKWLGWSKLQYSVTSQNGTKAVIHYVGKFENGFLKYVDDFKFK